MGRNIDFDKGTLLFFKPFYFPDGGKPASKFFLVLHNDKESLLLVSLPTSKDHVPSDVEMTSGCIELPERSFNAFVFIANTEVTESFCFDRDTFIYGSSIHEYDVAALMQPVKAGKSKVEAKGRLLPGIYQDLIRCLKSSDSVRRRYKKML